MDLIDSFPIPVMFLVDIVHFVTTHIKSLIYLTSLLSITLFYIRVYNISVDKTKTNIYLKTQFYIVLEKLVKCRPAWQINVKYSTDWILMKRFVKIVRRLVYENYRPKRKYEYDSRTHTLR